MRVLQVGFGVIGKEVFTDYSRAFVDEVRYMVTDRAEPVPSGYEWDGRRVDLAVILVNTPGTDAGDGFDYTDLLTALAAYLSVADFILIRSTVGLGFLHTHLYRENADLIGFSPEFYGATKWSRRAALDMGFTIFTDNVPEWFTDRVCRGDLISARAAEVIVAKLSENAFLATKVTFFHELSLTCRWLGLDFEEVRKIVTADPRIGPAHSQMEQLGWQSHCLDKDVPAFTRLGPSTELVQSAIEINRTRLIPERSVR